MGNWFLSFFIYHFTYASLFSNNLFISSISKSISIFFHVGLTVLMCHHKNNLLLVLCFFCFCFCLQHPQSSGVFDRRIIVFETGVSSTFCPHLLVTRGAQTFFEIGMSMGGGGGGAALFFSKH